MSLPSDFVRIHPQALCRALTESEPQSSIRINPAKAYKHNLSDRVEWCDEGFYLDQRPVFTLDPAFAAGAYYVQEASSMFVGWLTERIELPDNPVVLDLCAAPGGKSTHLSSIIGQQGVLVANETIKARAGILAQNIQKWGEGNTIVTSADATAFGNMGATFDLVVVDAPCSGEGMFRKDERAREEWSLENVEKCAARQRRIVADVWDALCQDGYMIYSTCTFNSAENEQNALWIARELGAEIVSLDNFPNQVTKNPECGYNFYPHKARGEGFYSVVLRKTSSAAQCSHKAAKNTPQSSDRYSTSPLLIVQQNGSNYGYTKPVWYMVELLRAARVFMLYAGVEIGVEIRDQLKTAHPLALYRNVRSDLFPRAELDTTQAIEYLRKGIIEASLMEEGVNFICHQGLSIGFAKRIGGRVNNMYPVAWRIATL